MGLLAHSWQANGQNWHRALCVGTTITSAGQQGAGADRFRVVERERFSYFSCYYRSYKRRWRQLSLNVRPLSQPRVASVVRCGALRLHQPHPYSDAGCVHPHTICLRTRAGRPRPSRTCPHWRGAPRLASYRPGPSPGPVPVPACRSATGSPAGEQGAGADRCRVVKRGPFSYVACYCCSCWRRWRQLSLSVLRLRTTRLPCYTSVSRSL